MNSSMRSSMRRTFTRTGTLTLGFFLLPISPAQGQIDSVQAAQEYGRKRPVLRPQPDGLIVCEAEEFQSAGGGWQARPWGENYYAATMANTFLSRKAFLAAPKQCEQAIATLDVQIEKPGQYLVLVRYEAAYRFETRFTVRIEQNGKKVFERLYGARDNLKIWAFGKKLQKEVAWPWGACENIVWEGHDAVADLAAGRARVSLIAQRQPEPAARRHVDLLMLTTDARQVKMRIEKERYLPLDGMLTQAGDVFMRVENRGPQRIAISGQRFLGGTCQQHSPYWVHLRNWKPLGPLHVPPGKRSSWVEVGSRLDSLNDGQWGVTISPPSACRIEFGVRTPTGRIETIARFDGTFGNLPLAFHSDTRYCRRLRHRRDVLFDLLAHLEKQPRFPPPRRTPVYAHTFEKGLDPDYDQAVDTFIRLYRLRRPNASGFYLDVRSIPTDKLEAFCRKLGGQAERIEVVSLGDEISLPRPHGDVHAQFRRWLKEHGVAPSELSPDFGSDYGKVVFDPDPERRETAPGIYYWSHRFLYDYGIRQIKKRTDILRRCLPNAHIGANYSPHFPADHAYLGEVFKWVTCFRKDGMTLPWSEDYVWQTPVGTLQMNNINLDLLRCGIRGKKGRKIMYYVMPHWPGNTPRSWRRLFFGAIGHGMTMVNLFEFRPVQVAYTENHVTHSGMYAEVLRSLQELARFEDIVQDGHVADGIAGLWFSETGDIWHDTRGSFSAAKRALYIAIRHRQIPLDVVVEPDALDGTLDRYKVLYLTDAHVSRKASQRIAEWVRRGGRLFATAGAGMYDERHAPNTVLRQLLGVEPGVLDEPPGKQVRWIKQDLPFVEPIDQIVWSHNGRDFTIPVLGVRARIARAHGRVVGKFTDGSPAIVLNTFGRGQTVYCAFLPGLSYFRPAVPKTPVQRGSRDGAGNHFFPTAFDPGAAQLVGIAAESLSLPYHVSHPLVEATMIRPPHGVAIPLVNWTNRPLTGITLTVNVPLPSGQAALASGRTVDVRQGESGTRFTFDLDVADVLILRNDK